MGFYLFYSEIHILQNATILDLDLVSHSVGLHNLPKKAHNGLMIGILACLGSVFLLNTVRFSAYAEL